MNKLDESNNQRQSGGSQTPPPATELSATEEEGGEPTGLTGQRAPRVFIRETIIRRLVNSGVPDDVASITKAVNELLDYALTSHPVEMVNMADVVAIEQSLADRVEELTATNIALAKVLYDLGAVIELDRIFGSFKTIAKSRIPANALPVTSTPEVKPVITNSPGR
jgi:hypothetical protein